MMVMDYLMMVMDWTEENIETDLSLTSLQLTCSSSHCSVTSRSKLVSKILSPRSLKRVNILAETKAWSVFFLDGRLDGTNQ